ncbi:MAG: NAD(P)-dependent oxidoreductase, partial [Clostridia bacterium]|nr:NAD(P)-dependent oxidoreductase [Clostridia bacterium]
MALHVLDEANRCLGCKNPSCVRGCPIKTPIPEVIKLLKENRLDEAGKVLFFNNPLTTVCSLVCNHEKQCEGHCVLAKKGNPVHFSAIENYISDAYAPKMVQGPARSNGTKVAIVGSGPAGLTIAIILARYGYQVTIFESKDQIGGILRYGIPEFRLPKTVLDDLQYRHIELKGIKIRPNIRIGDAIGIDDLFRDGYKAIFIGTGVWRANTLGIKGETLGNVHFAINYLTNPSVYKLGNQVTIIGAGNSAMDVARTALRNGSRKVTCFSLTEQVTASDYEYKYAKLEGVAFEHRWKPVEILDDGVIFRRVKEENGTVTEIENSDTFFPSTSVIIAISQGPRNVIVSSTTGLDVNKKGLLRADEFGKTSREGVFASGDVVNGARTVVEAVAHSKVVAETIHQYLQNL